MRSLLLTLIFLFFIQMAFSAASDSIELQAGSTNIVVDIFNHCKKLQNSSANNYFVPAKTDIEWSAFLNHLPSGVTPSECITYEWQSGAWGACTGGSGVWSYGSWGACGGGTASYSYGNWGDCSLTCGGGTKTRTSSCDVNTNSGQKARTATCDFTNNSGAQTATVQCASIGPYGDFLGYVADSFCTATKPPASQNCTPSDPSVCGASTTTEACTPSSVACAGSPDTSTSCNTQACCDPTNLTNQPGKTFSCFSFTLDYSSGALDWNCNAPGMSCNANGYYSGNGYNHAWSREMISPTRCRVVWETYTGEQDIVVTCQ
jgi:hypothetical protein